MQSFFIPLVEQVSAILALGGPVVALLVALSVIALALILLKFYQFWRAGLGRWHAPERALGLWQSGRKAEAMSLCQESPSIIARSLAAGMALRTSGKFDIAKIESEVTRFATVEIHKLQKGFKALDTIAQIAPLLGLFGTVLGMIEAFQAMQSAGAAVDPSVLAGGIWVALLTTAVGLAVAMPVSAILTMLESWVENERMALEDTATRWLNGVDGGIDAQADHTTTAPQTLTPTYAH
ncbi:MotA/TolQ/ExbB proton channel family protein [Pelagibacterium lentulum]|uniref:Biopolymer transporter ExbB n=1 Tax=Pelagibacterium lentulum TaxID=2029865 RepID=A0A916W0A2_9HYPH|nr:MotA/TolQ/ExbB proton channel family protein [Pelagibacterium lentulum]GGA57496.1 biopolymer transporter ExbB [Pelagibacterium lentulum]